MLAIKLLSITLILFVALIAGFYPFFKKFKHNTSSNFPLADAFAKGIFLGVGFLHMLGNAEADFVHRGYVYPWALLLAGSVFLILLGAELWQSNLASQSKKILTGFVVFTVILLSVHSLLAGMALGFSPSLAIYIILLLAILMHKGAASFALAVIINKSKLSTQVGIILFLIFAIMTPLGVLIATGVPHLGNPLLEPIFTACAAGTFIYLGTMHGLKNMQFEQVSKFAYFMLLGLGFALMAIVRITC